MGGVTQNCRYHSELSPSHNAAQYPLRHENALTRPAVTIKSTPTKMTMGVPGYICQDSLPAVHLCLLELEAKDSPTSTALLLKQ